MDMDLPDNNAAGRACGPFNYSTHLHMCVNPEAERKLTWKNSLTRLSADCKVAILILLLRRICRAEEIGPGIAGMPVKSEPNIVALAGMPNLRALASVSAKPA